MTPTFSKSSLYVVATLTESKTASTATPVIRFCSFNGIPSFSKVATSSGSSSSKLFGVSFSSEQRSNRGR